MVFLRDSFKKGAKLKASERTYETFKKVGFSRARDDAAKSVVYGTTERRASINLSVPRNASGWKYGFKLFSLWLISIIFNYFNNLCIIRIVPLHNLYLSMIDFYIWVFRAFS